MNRFKILTVTTSGLGIREGISTVILDYYSNFDPKTYQLEIVAWNDSDEELLQEFRNIGVNIRVLPSRKEAVVKYIHAFVNLIRTENYDALYIHGSSSIMTMELMLARFSGCSIRVVHSHNTTCDHKMVDKLLRPFFYHSYTTALACGMDAGKWLYGNHEFHIIKNGRDIDKYKFNAAIRETVRRELGLKNNTLAVGHVGYFNYQKNQEFLLKVLKELLNTTPNVKMFLVGDGPTRTDIMDKARIGGLADNICFTGSISNVPDMLQAMDIMVLPSLFEGLPLVSIEWQIAGLPCILSDCVTRECAYMDSVKFLPLNEEKWAEEILNIGMVSRKEDDHLIVQKTKDAGYSLKDSAEELQRYFRYKVS